MDKLRGLMSDASQGWDKFKLTTIRCYPIGPPAVSMVFSQSWPMWSVPLSAVNTCPRSQRPPSHRRYLVAVDIEHWMFRL